jgi:hypothetical protein
MSAPPARRDLAVDLPPVPDIKDPNLLGTVVNPKENTVVSDSNPPPLLELASEKFRSWRARIYR